MKNNHDPTRGHGSLEAYLADRRAEKADALIPAHHRAGRILDIGCGNYPRFLERVVFTEKWGVDQLIQALQSLQLDGSDARLLPFDANSNDDLPFEPETFDVVTMLAVFEHISPDRLVPLLRQVRRVLRHGGLYVMTTPAHWTGWLLRTMARLTLVSADEIHEHKGSYSHGYIREKLVAAGFDASRIQAGTFEFKANLWITAAK